ncbi:hypothetical protein QCA50_008709 [Cerrena zonata]|uniref:Tyrosinase copper-binding domain-containing protein n=1 Tax=Cerrena zonata TaxID=2478898 RepID=A0AAW0G9Z5_9APHY
MVMFALNLVPLACLLSSLLVGAIPVAESQLSKTCTKPGIRKEWRTLSNQEKASFIKAVHCLETLPHSQSIFADGSQPDVPPVRNDTNAYDDFVYAHLDGVNRNHFTGVFLGWHRWFLHTFENTLQTKCGYKGSLPYWDWSRDVANIPASPLFISSATTGFGTFNDNASENFTVTDGAFGATVRAYPTPHRVGRHFRPQPFEEQIFPFAFDKPEKLATSAFTPEEVHFIITNFVGNYTDFQAYMDGVRAEGMHNAAHLMMDGDMSNIGHSPNDPIFFLHHANLDRIWAAWQSHDPANRLAVGGGRTQVLQDYDEFPAGAPPFIEASEQLRFSGLTTEPLLGEVLQTKGKLLCYEYA